jgi:hypothetical protein
MTLQPALEKSTGLPQCYVLYIPAVNEHVQKLYIDLCIYILTIKAALHPDLL